MRLMTKTLKIVTAIYVIGVGLVALTEVIADGWEKGRLYFDRESAAVAVSWPVLPFLLVWALIEEILHKLGIMKSR